MSEPPEAAPDVAGFDAWYRAIDRSSRWDPFVQPHLGLPADVQSTGYLTGAGLTEVVDRLELRPEDVLLELGCGRAGYGLAVIQGTGARLVGVDLSAVAVGIARRRAAELRLDGRVEFRVGDLVDTGLPAGCAEAVLCVDAFHFAASTRAAAAECRRVLVPSGRLVVTTWRPAVPGDRALPARHRRLDVGADLRRAGFVDVEVLERPDWAEAEVALWTTAVGLAVEDDAAMAELRDEASEFLPLAPGLRRVLVVGRAPG